MRRKNASQVLGTIQIRHSDGFEGEKVGDCDLMQYIDGTGDPKSEGKNTLVNGYDPNLTLLM